MLCGGDARPKRSKPVAAHAGVSPITVSRVVRLPGLVAPATRARVEAAMRDLATCRTWLRARLASARTRLVAVLVPTIANSIFADTVQGLSDVLEPLGYAVTLAQSRYDDAREERILSALLSRRPEALIMVGSPATEDGARLLQRAGNPGRGGRGSCRSGRSTRRPGSTTGAAGAAVAAHMAADGAACAGVHRRR